MARRFEFVLAVLNEAGERVRQRREERNLAAQERHRFETVAVGGEVLLYDLGELVARMPMPHLLRLPGSSGEPFSNDA